ncbi:Hypothetical protein LUCI_5186 [Lucifera butyrica]|uniref:Uncharacterized protein n=1 Tax=Lucifera butyrica TaxID=1351585 RepID=A0A498RLE7_9FIRM|nr:hypothetical protein [Lucifera butyrica]VBB09888.1 Hypothetical protein LUCI_5186 [Lucifera butyrica]
MRKFAPWILAVIFSILTVTAAVSPVSAASPAPEKVPLNVKVTIDQPNVFWNYTFLTKNTDLGKPAVVKLTWSTSNIDRKENSEIIVAKGKIGGQTSIPADKDALVNIQVSVFDKDDIKLGTISLQVRNNGQTENIGIAPPDFTEPKMIWGTFN